MSTRITKALATIAISLSLGALAAPTAAAAPAEPAATPVTGSIGFCIVIPLGSVVFPICI